MSRGTSDTVSSIKSDRSHHTINDKSVKEYSSYSDSINGDIPALNPSSSPNNTSFNRSSNNSISRRSVRNVREDINLNRGRDNDSNIMSKSDSKGKGRDYTSTTTRTAINHFNTSVNHFNTSVNHFDRGDRGDRGDKNSRSDVKNIMSSNNVVTNTERSLREMGYEPVNTITLKNGNKVDGKYIEAINPLGSTVYIDINDTTQSPQSSIVATKTNRPIETISEEVKKESIEMSQPETRGMAIKCEGGLCLLVNKGKDIEETTYNVSEFREGIKTFPIVNIKDITYNKESVIENTETVTNRVLDEYFKQSYDILRRADDNFTALHNSLREYYVIYDNAAADIAKSSDEVGDRLQKMYKNPPTDRVLKEERKTLILEMNRLEGLNHELLKASKVIEEISNRMAEMTIEIKNLNNYARGVFENI